MYTLPWVHVRDRAGSHRILVLWDRQPGGKEGHENNDGFRGARRSGGGAA